MKHVAKSVLLWYSPEEMYRLVTAVRDYPAFLPWCDSAEVISEDDSGMTARIGLAFAGVRQTFSTRNQHTPGREVLMRLVEGPFSVLEGTWRFLPLGPAGAAPNPGACKVEFVLRYDFSSRALALVLSPVFDRVANTLVDSFVARAEQVYGSR